MDPRPALAVLVAVLLLGSSAFAVDVAGGRQYEPVPFEDTIELGMTGAVTVRADGGSGSFAVPKAEAFYSGYRYVVGYYGVETLVDHLESDGHEVTFGRPLAVFVTDFADSGVSLSPEGYLTLPDSLGQHTGWVPASEAVYVVGSEARTPAGPVVVPFSSRAAATSFVEAYGGEVREWSDVRETSFGTGAATRDGMREAVRERTVWADQQVAATRTLLDRPVSIVVGEDAPTVAAAVASAPPNTTVRIPAGTYDVPELTVEKPLTIRGVGNATHLRGSGNGSVVRVRASNVAVVDLRITGVGNRTSPDVRRGNDTDWDYAVQMGYGFGDAAVDVVGVSGTLVDGVWTRTPSNGVLLRDTNGTVVEGVTVVGEEEWMDGFMGVMSMRARPVVQDSTFVEGRDGVYTHLSDGIVVRDNRMRGNRFGVHLMYTSDALLANNTVRDAGIGLVVMTRPEGNALVDNDVRSSNAGMSVAGGRSYVAGNVLVENRYGLQTPSRRTLYERNVLAYNDVGLRASSILPTNRVVSNDFVHNDLPVTAALGPLQVLTVDGRGNYWADAPGFDRDGDGVIEREYAPTGAVDRLVGRVGGARTLAHSPGLAAVRALGEAVPGLRGTGALDTAPLARPVRPEVVAALNRSTDATEVRA
ncbi:NosD domain-containing protein [Salinirubellus sp. GCM10025818]|uniref:NosD domain-containing protein n=1 Tax=Salinirubellus TaxID=2162630 RepID=UPI0030CC61A2